MYAGFSESMTYIMLVLTDLFLFVAKWEMMYMYTASDHKFISFGLKRNVLSQRLSTENIFGWNISKLDRGKFFEQKNSSPEDGLMMRREVH